LDPIAQAEELAGKLDGLVEPAREPENRVLTDNVRLVRWTGPLFALFSLVLLPWTIYLAYSLPSRQVSPDYDVAWAGFDVMLMAVLAGTALLRPAALPLSGGHRERDGSAADHGRMVRCRHLAAGPASRRGRAGGAG
jgi:hypothetical protein